MAVPALAYYVYYRVAHPESTATRTRVLAFVRAVEAAAGCRGRLLVKRDQPDLWMEVFEEVADDRFEALLSELWSRHGLAEALATASSRRIECFLDPRSG